MMATQNHPKKHTTQTKRYHSKVDWPDERPPLQVHLQQQEKRIRRVAAKAVSMSPEYEDDMAQELRLRAIRAWETWDKNKGSLSAHTWRYIVGSHLKLLRRSWTYPLGYRFSRKTAPSVYSLNQPMGDDGDEFIFNLPGGADVPENEIMARREVSGIMPRIQGCIGKQITVSAAIERLTADEGEIVDVARRQGVSIQAVYSSRKRMLASIREALEVEHD